MFRRYTLILAENARGKTTLCDILRSLSTNAPAIVIGRATLGSPDPPEIQLLMTAGNIAFRSGGWTTAYPDVAVFDGTYVRENVFAGDAVDTEHRRNLYRVIIGAQGVALATRVDDLDNQIRAKNTEIRDNRAQMQRHIPQTMTPEVFIALAEDPEIDGKIAAKEQELQASRQAAQLQQRAGFCANRSGLPGRLRGTAREDVCERRGGCRTARQRASRASSDAVPRRDMDYRRLAVHRGRRLSVLRPADRCGRAHPGLQVLLQPRISRAQRRSDRAQAPGGRRHRGAHGGGARSNDFAERQCRRIMAAVLRTHGAGTCGSEADWGHHGRAQGIRAGASGHQGGNTARPGTARQPLYPST